MHNAFYQDRHLDHIHSHSQWMIQNLIQASILNYSITLSSVQYLLKSNYIIDGHTHMLKSINFVKVSLALFDLEQRIFSHSYASGHS